MQHKVLLFLNYFYFNVIMCLVSVCWKLIFFGYFIGILHKSQILLKKCFFNINSALRVKKYWLKKIEY